VPHQQPDQLQIGLNLISRLFLIPLAILILFVSWFASRWLVGNTMAESADNLEIARMSVSLAPDDPHTHFTYAALLKRGISAENLREALRHIEIATSLSPNDYRLWIELGRLREQLDQPVAAEEALRNSTKLAPTYAYPRWYLGNFLLRQGKVDEGIAELRLAGERNEAFLPQILNLLSKFHGEDLDAITRSVGDSQAIQVELVQFLAHRNSLDKASDIWLQLPKELQVRKSHIGIQLMGMFMNLKQFHKGARVYKTLSRTGSDFAKVDEIQNNGFEDDIIDTGHSPFGWKVLSGNNPQIRIDTRVRHTGDRSLRLLFNAPKFAELKGFSQLVLVEPQAHYRLEYSVKSQDLKTALSLFLEVVDANSGTILATSQATQASSEDWKRTELTFSTPQSSEAIILRLSSSKCASEVCPIFGKVWYDNFNLKRIPRSEEPATKNLP
jgi:tetratricopeptide (TPR) repeat protein